MRALGQQDLTRQFSDAKKDLGTFLKGKKVTKGVYNVVKLATLCISISPTMGQTENTLYVNKTLIKIVPLKLICVNAFTLTALIYTYIYIYIYIYTYIHTYIHTHTHTHKLSLVVCIKLHVVHHKADDLVYCVFELRQIRNNVSLLLSVLK